MGAVDPETPLFIYVMRICTCEPSHPPEAFCVPDAFKRLAKKHSIPTTELDKWNPCMWDWMSGDQCIECTEDELRSSSPYVGIDPNPFRRVHEQNREKWFVTGDKSTAHGKGRWVIELLIGPFYAYGCAIRDNWRRKNRMLPNRLHYAIDVAKAFDAQISVRSKTWFSHVAGVSVRASSDKP